jgi:hypothetical protein
MTIHKCNEHITEEFGITDMNTVIKEISKECLEHLE